ncbi:hypothetical protein FTO70_03180 [Methanosarcina sp. KYL-1]|nr:hypothetical protein [Methanosarcina sp. KYL-1]
MGLAFTLISVVKLNYVPEWKIDAEKDYSYDAWSNMEDVKTRADLFTRFMDSDSNYPYGLSATVPFSMGGGEIPVFDPSKSNGKLAVNTQGCTMSITLANHSNDPRPVDCGGITYYSENRQYPDQVFRYENGALILAQGNNSQMKRDPLFNISKYMGNYTVTINAINLTGETASISSSTFTALRLTGESIKPVFNSNDYGYLNESINSFNLTISTHYTDAWSTYLNNTAKEAKLEYGIDYKITYPDSDYVCLSFLPTDNNTYNIYINQTVICTELGGGFLTGDTVMKLGKWYNFNTVSDNGADSGVDLLSFKDYGTVVSFPANDPYDGVLNPYSKDNNVFYYDDKNTLELTFGFNGYTKLESKPTSATIRMIYHYTFTNTDPGSVQVAGENLSPLTGPNNEWCLYNKTTPIDITDPSDLTLDLQLNYQNPKYIEIDYLAVRLD